jgi:hypothetical protein
MIPEAQSPIENRHMVLPANIQVAPAADMLKASRALRQAPSMIPQRQSIIPNRSQSAPRDRRTTDVSNRSLESDRAERPRLSKNSYPRSNHEPEAPLILPDSSPATYDPTKKLFKHAVTDVLRRTALKGKQWVSRQVWMHPL